MPHRTLPAVIVVTWCAATACGNGRHAAAPIESSSSVPVADPKATAELDHGERMIKVAGGDCAAACSGLARMTTARITLCSPRTSACDDAERREGEARTRVAGFCDCGAP
jgi:hypothetical protein